MQCQNITFKSGINNKLLNAYNKVNTTQIEYTLRNKNIDANFENCKVVAFAISQIAKIFTIFNKENNFKGYSILSPQLRVYEKSNLNFSFNGYGFCIPETQQILKNEKSFLTTSIFYEKEDSLELLNTKLDNSYNNNQRSSSHYLSPFIHEIMHSTYIDFIYKKYGYEGACNYTKAKYNKEKACGLKIMKQLKYLTFSKKENNTIKNVLGLYATSQYNQYHEIFAETFTKLICECLSPEDSMPIKNPTDEIKNYPKDFLLILNKLFKLDSL